MGGGPSESTLNQQQNISSQQQQISSESEARAQQQYDQSQALAQPLIAQQTKLATGSPSDVLAAAMPTISQISGGYQGAKQSIMNSLPPGAARDTALANLETQKATSIGSTEANLVQGAPSVLANLGAGAGAFSVQELGGALSGLTGASSTNNTVLQAQTQQQAAKLGLAGSALGGVGEAAGGGVFGKL